VNISLGYSDAGPVHLDLDNFIRTKLFLSATSGGGKSELIRLLLEQIVPHVQCIVLDPEGEFATLRNGGFPFVLVGEGGETPAHPKTAAQLALTLLRERASAVCDLYELKGNGRHEFIANFISAVVDAPKELWHPVLIVIDEAHTFAPESGYGESVAKQPIIDLANLGRKRGFCLVLATQRASKISNNAIEPLQNQMIGLTTSIDQKRVCDTFKIAPGTATREFSLELESLEPGEFYARGPAISKRPVKLQVLRAETKPPKTGSAAAAKRPPAPESIKHLLPTLADIPLEVERKAATESDLRKQLADLRRDLAEAQRSVTAASKTTLTPERERMLMAQVQELQKTAGAYEKAMAKIGASAGRMGAAAKEIEEQVLSLQMSKAYAAPLAEVVASTLAPRAFIAPPTRAPRESASDGEGLSGPEQRIVDSIAWFHALGIDTPEQSAVAFMAGYTHGAGGYNNPRGRLNARGLVAYHAGDKIALTEAGRAVANWPATVGSNDELQAAVLAKLGGPEQRILNPLLASFPEGMDNKALADAAGYAHGAGGYNNPRGRLKSLGLIEYRDGMVFAREILFPEAR
jgi:hypothetical protein